MGMESGHVDQAQQPGEWVLVPRQPGHGFGSEGQRERLVEDVALPAESQLGVGTVEEHHARLLLQRQPLGGSPIRGYPLLGLLQLPAGRCEVLTRRLSQLVVPRLGGLVLQQACHAGSPSCPCTA